MTDGQILDFLDDQVDLIYLKDGRVIDVRGQGIRKAIGRKVVEGQVPEVRG